MDQVQQQTGPSKSRTLVEIDGDFLKAQDERDSFLSTTKPSPFEKDAFEDYNKRLEELDRSVAVKQKELVSGLRGAQPEEIDGYQAHLDARQQQEQAQNEVPGRQEEEQPRSSLSDMLGQRRGNAWSPNQAQAGEAQDESQAQSQQRTQSRPQQQVGRGYADYARSSQEDHDQKQSMEEMESAYRAQNLGAGTVTVEQIETWHAQQKAQQSDGQSNTNASEKSERDWNDQVLGSAKHAPQIDEPERQRYRPQSQ